MSHNSLEDSSPYGLTMTQVHPSGNRIAIAVYDNGIGMMNSLKIGGVAVSGPEDAIISGLQKGITDGKGRETAFGSSMKSSKKAKALSVRLAAYAALLWHQRFPNEQGFPKGVLFQSLIGDQQSYPGRLSNLHR